MESCETCDVPCKPVSDNIEKLHVKSDTKLNTKLFMWVIGGIGAIGLLLFGLLMSGQTKTSDTMIEIKMSVEKQDSRVQRIEEKVNDIKEAIRK